MKKTLLTIWDGHSQISSSPFINTLLASSVYDAWRINRNNRDLINTVNKVDTLNIYRILYLESVPDSQVPQNVQKHRKIL